MTIYLYDGSLEGLLSAVFEWFERRESKIQLINKILYQPDAFSITVDIFNDKHKAERVWKGLQKKLDKA